MCFFLFSWFLSRFECFVDVNMPSHGQKSKDKSLDSSEEGRSALEYARTGSLVGESATGRRETSGASLIPASDTTCPNEQLSLQTSIESGFTTMSCSPTKAIRKIDFLTFFLIQTLSFNYKLLTYKTKSLQYLFTMCGPYITYTNTTILYLQHSAFLQCT